MHVVRLKGQKNHVFVDNVRFWAMLAVIALHCVVVFSFLNSSQRGLTMLVSTPLKFGTIGFFLISGFLLGDRLRTSCPVEYLSRRMKTVFVPWVCWFSLMLVYRVGHHRAALTMSASGLRLVGNEAFHVLFATPFWFVPNLLLGLCLLLLFRRYVFDLRLGAAFLAIDLFYTANIYGEWIPSAHTEALLGFIFFLWLGSYASHKFENLNAWLTQIPMPVMVALTVAAACLAFGEAVWLNHLGSADPVNTLRGSNQIFSILVVLTLVKVKRATWPGFVNARRDTFGLYLSHTLVLELGLRVVQAASRGILHRISTSREGLLLLWLALSISVYAVGLAVTKLLGAWAGTGWSVGVGSGDASARSRAGNALGGMQPDSLHQVAVASEG